MIISEKWDKEWKQLAEEKNKKNINKNNGIKDMQEIASRLTREKSMKLIANREQFIQEQMQKIDEEEYQSEVQTMLEDENYNDEEWDMILGSNGQNNVFKKDDVQEKMLVKKREDINGSS